MYSNSYFRQRRCWTDRKKVVPDLKGTSLPWCKCGRCSHNPRPYSQLSRCSNYPRLCKYTCQTSGETVPCETGCNVAHRSVKTQNISLSHYIQNYIGLHTNLATASSTCRPSTVISKTWDLAFILADGLWGQTKPQLWYAPIESKCDVTIVDFSVFYSSCRSFFVLDKLPWNDSLFWKPVLLRKSFTSHPCFIFLQFIF